VLAVVAALCGVALWTSLARRTSLDPAKIQTAGLLAVLCIVLGVRACGGDRHWQGFLQAPLLILGAGTLSTGSAVTFGVLLAAIVTIAYLLLARMPVIRALDAAAPAVVLALAILDVANFAAGSRYGAPTDLSWASLIAAVLRTYRGVCRWASRCIPCSSMRPSGTLCSPQCLS